MLSLTKLLLPNYVQILKRKREREKEREGERERGRKRVIMELINRINKL